MPAATPAPVFPDDADWGAIPHLATGGEAEPRPAAAAGHSPPLPLRCESPGH